MDCKNRAKDLQHLERARGTMKFFVAYIAGFLVALLLITSLIVENPAMNVGFSILLTVGALLFNRKKKD